MTDDDVVFEPTTTNIDEGIIITPIQEVEKDIKGLLDKLSDIEGIERKYSKGDPLTEDEQLLIRLKTIALDNFMTDTTETPSKCDTVKSKVKSDGSTASYYELPEGAAELQDLISYKNLNAQMGEIFRAVYRYGQVEHSEKIRDAKKIKFYIEAEIARLEKYGD